jgi:Protein of unknown function (DUF3168)
MFAATYFAPTYFAPTYFAEVGSSSSYATFWEAMRAQVLSAVPSLTGLYAYQAPRDALPPMAVYSKGGSQPGYNTAGESLSDGQFSIAVYDVSDSSAVSVASSIATALNLPALSFTDGSLIYCRANQIDSVTIDPDPAPSSWNCAYAFQAVVSLRYMIQRST